MLVEDVKKDTASGGHGHLHHEGRYEGKTPPFEASGAFKKTSPLQW